MRENPEVETQSMTGAEFEAALANAEGLLQSVELVEFSLARYRAGTYLYWVASLGGGASVATLVGTPAAWLLPAGIVALNAIAGRLIETRVVSRLQETASKDERCAVETIEMLRELLPFVSTDERWSLFRIQHIKLRLARFPIGIAGR